MTSHAAKTPLSLVVAMMASLYVSTPALAQTPGSLVNIFDRSNTRSDASAVSDRFNGCPRPPAAVTSHRSVDIYADQESWVISGERWTQLQTSSRTIRSFAYNVMRLADGALHGAERKDARAACAARWLDSWATQGALLGDVPPESRYDTLWFAQVPLGVAFLKIKDNPAVTTEQRRRISAWITEIARAGLRDEATVIATRGERASFRSWSNAAAAVAAVASGDQALLATALNAAKVDLESITADGAIPSMISRGRRAFQHHVWAFEPLALTVLIGERNGVRLASVNDHALRRLLKLIIATGSGEPGIRKLAGVDQDNRATSWPRDFEIGGLEIFNTIERLPEVEALLASRRPVRSPFTGGDWTFAPVGRIEARARAQSG